MRLLNVHKLQTESKSPSTGDYAILSHTWGAEEDEVTFQDLQEPDERSKKKGWSKILGCCEQAKSDGIDWVWIDTCCIDKRSSAELSEAINSMYAWYRDSAVCYVFLEDVPPLAPGFPRNEFQDARWFTRGWCLQELIAPSKVEFYAKHWTDIGTRWSLHETIRDITGIPSSVLLDGDGLQKGSIAQKMSWASQRRTTRDEDEAYCLLGILDVNMPLLYGEGRKAFRRLLSEILREHEDYSFLLWTAQGSQDINESLAPAALEPGFFQTKGLSLSETIQCPYDRIEPAKSLPEPLSQALARRSPPQLTSRGLQVEMLVQREPPAFPGLEHEETSLLFTEFMYEGKLVCIALDANDETDILTTYWRASYDRVFLVDADLMEESSELLKIHLAVSHRGQRSTTQRFRKRPGLRIHLLSKCSSTAIGLIESIPTINFSVPGQPLTCHPPPGLRLDCLELDPAVQESRTQPGIPLLLHFKLCRNEFGASIETDLVLSIWLNSLAPRCCFRPYSDLEKLAKEDTDERLKSLEDEYEKSTDRARCQLFNGRNIIVVMVKGCEHLASVGADNPQKPMYYAVYVIVLEDASPRRRISQEMSESSEIRKRKRTIIQQSEDIESSLETSNRRRLCIEISSDSE